MSKEQQPVLGPDGKEWAKTEAGYRHVDGVMHAAIEGPEGLMWYGHRVREAFVAGAEWQESRHASALAAAFRRGLERAAEVALEQQKYLPIWERAAAHDISIAIRAAAIRSLAEEPGT